jgi:hypothetical protein
VITYATEYYETTEEEFEELWLKALPVTAKALVANDYLTVNRPDRMSGWFKRVCEVFR